MDTVTDLQIRRTSLNGSRVNPLGMIESVTISNEKMNGSDTSLRSSSSRLAVSQNDLVEKIRPDTARRATTAKKLYVKKRRKLKTRDTDTDKEKRLERASDRRAKLLLKKMIAEKTGEALDRIQRYLGVDDKSYCLRHPNQRICGRVDQYTFETIMICKICESEQVAGGKRQRASMAPVIKSIEMLQKDKRQWRKKTKIMYHGKGYHSDDEDSDDGRSVGTHSTGTISVEDILAFCQSVDNDPGDEEWKEGVAARVAQVRAWDGKAALKCNPIYAKYFRMQNLGIPLDAIKQACELDGWEPTILDLDPNRPLKDQLDLDTDLSEMEKEELLWYANNSTDQLDNHPTDIQETIEIVHQAYVRRKSVLEEHIMEQNKEKESKKWIRQNWGDLLKSPESIQPKPASKSFKEESEASKELQYLIEEEEEEEREKVATAAAAAAAAAAAYLEKDLKEEKRLEGSFRGPRTLSLPIISESDNGENEKPMRPSLQGSERMERSSSISIHSIQSVQSALSEFSNKSKGKRKKRNGKHIKGKSKKGRSKKYTDRRGDSDDTMSSNKKSLSGSNNSAELVEEGQDVSSRLKNANRMLIEKDIITTSLITQVAVLQSDLEAMKIQNKSEKGGRFEDDADALKSQLVDAQKEIAEKNTILSSLVAQVQSLQSVVEEKNMVIASQAALIENFQSQVNSKQAIIGVLEQSISNLEEESEHSRRLLERSFSPTKQISPLKQMLRAQPKLDDTDGTPLPPLTPFEQEMRGSHIIAGANSPEKRQSDPNQNGQHLPREIQASTMTPRQLKTQNPEEPTSTIPSLDSVNLPLVNSVVKTSVVDGKQQDKNNVTLSLEEETVLSASEDQKGKDEDMKTESKKKKRRKSSKSKKKRNAKSKEKSSDGKTGKRKKKKKGTSNLDPSFLREKFKECVNKLIVINRAFQLSDVEAVFEKEMENDRLSFRRSSSMMTDWIAPDEWNAFFSDDEISDEDIIEPSDTDLTTARRVSRRVSRRTSATAGRRTSMTAGRRTSATAGRRTSLVMNGRRTSLVNGKRVSRRLSDLQLKVLLNNSSLNLDLATEEEKTETPPSSPETPVKRLSIILSPTPTSPEKVSTPEKIPTPEKEPKASILRPPKRAINSPPSNDRSITWISDEIVHTETLIEKLAVELKRDLWYTADDYKLFSFEKYMEEHEEEFEIVDTDEEDEYSYFEEESYYSGSDEDVEDVVITEDSYLEIEEDEDIVEEADFIISSRSRRSSL